MSYQCPTCLRFIAESLHTHVCPPITYGDPFAVTRNRQAWEHSDKVYGEPTPPITLDDIRKIVREEIEAALKSDKS